MREIYRTYQSILRFTDRNIDLALLFISSNIIGIYNNINYDIRTTQIVSYSRYLEKYKSHWRAQYLRPGTLQQTISLIVKGWQSFLKAKDYFISRKDYANVPNCPGYKYDINYIDIIINREDIILCKTGLYIRFADSIYNRFGMLYLIIEYCMIWGINYDAKRKQICSICNDLRQIRIVRDTKINAWKIKLIYAISPEILPQKFKNVMSIDIGLNNLCAITFRYGNQTYIINGRPLKSYNHYANYRISEIQSSLMKNMTTSKEYQETKEISMIRKKRADYINNYLHQASRCCVNIALQMTCKVIVIGDLQGIKQGNKNKSFVQIPLLRFIEMIKYKAESAGLKVVTINESYTSMSSAIDLEDIKYEYGRAKRRIYRGAFISNQGLMINSDINGSLNILRKFLTIVYSKRMLAQQQGKYADMTGSIPEMITTIRDKGIVVDPIKITLVIN